MKAPVAKLRAWARRQRRDRMTAEARKACPVPVVPSKGRLSPETYARVLLAHCTNADPRWERIIR